MADNSAPAGGEQPEWGWSTGAGARPKGPVVKGKKSAVHLPGGKKELRRALIDQKRAERSSKAGHFDAVALFEALLAGLESEEPSRTSPQLGKPALKTATKIGRLLQYRCTEQGSGDKRVVLFTRDESHPPPSKESIDEAMALAADFSATADGTAAAAVLQGQRDKARKIRERKAREAANGGITRKLRVLYPGDTDDSDDDEAEAEAGAADGAEATGDHGGNAATGAGGHPRTKLITVVRKPVPFVHATGAVSLGEAGADAAHSAAAGGRPGQGHKHQDHLEAVERHAHAAGGFQDLADDEEEGEDSSAASESSGTEDEDAATPHAGLGAAAGGSDNDTGLLADRLASMGLGSGIPSPPLASPVIQADWERNTRGVGSKLLARMGYAGGQLGRPGTTTAAIRTTPVGSLPDPIGEDVVVKKDRGGIGHGIR